MTCLLSACAFDRSGKADGDDVAVDAPELDAPSIDAPDDAAIDAAIDAPTDAPPDAACVPGCNGDLLTECTPGPTTRTCDLGCVPTGVAHCGALVPSNLPGTNDLQNVTAGLTFGAGDFLLDTATGVISDANGVIIRPASDTTMVYRMVSTTPPIAVLAVTQLTIPATATVYAVGLPSLIILSRGPVTIAGELDFSAGCTVGGNFTRRCGGPGAGWGGNPTMAMGAGTGCAGGAGGVGDARRTGGAGGGFATMGGQGAASGANPATMPSGLGTCVGASLIPLTGGGGGGAGDDSSGAVGGGGGGAVQITSLQSISVVSPSPADTADIWAPGAGGKAPSTANAGGGGGGAGGAILLEAPTVTVTNGRLTVAGGGGAGGRTTGANADGTYGRHDGVPAAGGAGDGFGGAGGAGATNSAMAANGTGGNMLDGTGAGGGGLGKIRVNTRSGTWTVPGGSLAVGDLTTGTLDIR